MFPKKWRRWSDGEKRGFAVIRNTSTRLRGLRLAQSTSWRNLVQLNASLCSIRKCQWGIVNNELGNVSEISKAPAGHLRALVGRTSLERNEKYIKPPLLPSCTIFIPSCIIYLFRHSNQSQSNSITSIYLQTSQHAILHHPSRCHPGHRRHGHAQPIWEPRRRGTRSWDPSKLRFYRTCLQRW